MFYIVKGYAQNDFQDSTIVGSFDDLDVAKEKLKTLVEIYQTNKNFTQISNSDSFYSFTNNTEDNEQGIKDYFHTWYQIVWF